MKDFISESARIDKGTQQRSHKKQKPSTAQASGFHPLKKNG
jgi:hypothetical protein